MIDLLVVQITALVAAIVWTLLLRPRPLCLVPMTVVLLHIVVLQSWVLITGLTTGLNIGVWRVVSAVVLIMLALAVRLKKKRLLAELRKWHRRIRRTRLQLGNVRMALMYIIPPAMLLYIGICGLLLGPYLSDVNSYHLVPPTDWIVEGRIVTNDWLDPRTWWPQGHGLLVVAWGLPTKWAHALPLAGLHWVALTFTVAWAIARQMGGTVRAAFHATLFVAAIPIVWAQGSQCLNDLAMGSLALTAVACVAGRRVESKHVIIAIAAILVGLGVKPTLLLIGPPIVSIALVRWWLHRNKSTQANDLLQPLVLLAFATVLGGVWYMRNVILRHDHNALYPASLHLLGFEIWQGDPGFAKQHGHIKLTQLLDNLSNLFLYIGWDHRGFSDAQTMNSSGWGWLAMGMGWASSLGLFIHTKSARPALLMLLGMMALMGLGIEADLWHGRLYCYVPIVLVTCAALTTERISGRIAKMVWFILLSVSLIGSVGIGLLRTVPQPIGEHWYDHSISWIDSKLIPSSNREHLLHSVNEHVPPNAPLVVFDTRFGGPVALLHGEELSRRLIYQSSIPDSKQIAVWHEEGIRWVVIAMDPANVIHYAKVFEALNLHRVEEGLYEIP